MRISPVALLVLLQLAVPGCFTVKEIALKDNLEKAINEAKEKPVRAGRSRPLAVGLADPAVMGCVVVDSPPPAKAQNLGKFECAMVALQGEDPEDDLEERADKVDHKKLGLLVKDLGPSTVALLDRRINERFPSSRVRLASGAGAPGEIRVRLSRFTYYQDGAELAEKHCLTTLTATVPGRPPVQGHGHAMIESSGGHYVWIFTIAILLMPIGSLPGMIYLNSAHHAQVSMAILRSVDQAAMNLAENLARGTAAGPGGAALARGGGRP
jgi:hypothetical protein